MNSPETVHADAKQKLHEEWEKVSGGKRVVVFGTGKECSHLLDMLPVIRLSIKYIADNDAALWSCERYGFPIKSPEELKKENPDHLLIVIAMRAYYQVIPQIKEYGAFEFIAFNDGQWINPYEVVVTDISRVLLRVETTSYCNLRCSFCMHAKMRRPKGIMDQKLFEQIIREGGASGFKMLDIRNFGEPLLDTMLEGRISFAKNNGFTDVFLYTNAVLLSEARYKALGESGLGKIIISLSPRREYNKTRKGISFDEIVERLKALAGKNEPEIIIHLVSPESTEEEAEACITELNGLGFDKIEKVHIHNWGRAEKNASASTKFPCRRVWNSLTVLHDGRVALCCIDIEGEYILGDAREQTLAEIINSEKYTAARRQQLAGEFPDICKDCTNFG